MFQFVNLKKLGSKTALYKYSILSAVAVFSSAVGELTALSDDELTDIAGQASLMSIDKYNFNTGADTNNFYRMTMNTTVQTSLNIDRLRLRDGAGADQIDIEDLSIGGGVNNQASSATLTNPFVEFAFAGDIDSDLANNREIIGIRFGAEGMNGTMSFGQQHPTDANQDTGINTFSGYMTTNSLSGIANTNAVDRDGFLLTSGLNVIGVFSGTLNMPNTRVQFGALSANFTAPAVTINGTGITQTTINTDTIVMDPVAYQASGSGTATVDLGFLIGNININTGVDASGTLSNVQVDGTVTQDLKTIHRVSINDGFYLSAQNRAVNWRGSEAADTAQQGWWMGFNGQVQIDPITLDAVTLPDSTIQSILDSASAQLAADPISLSVTDVINGFGGQVNKTVNITLPNPPTQTPAPLVLTNQQLGASQAPIVNCWNGSIGC